MEESMRQRTEFLKASVFFSTLWTPLDSLLSEIKGRYLLTGKWANWAADQHGKGLWSPPLKGVTPSPAVVEVLTYFQMTGKDTKILPQRFANGPLIRVIFSIEIGTSWSCRRMTGCSQLSKCKVLTYPEPKVNSLGDLANSLNFSGP